MVDIYEKFQKICDVNSISDEDKKSLFMMLVYEEKKMREKHVGLDDLKQYLREEKGGVSSSLNDIKYLVSEVYGVFFADNSFAFAYDYQEQTRRGLLRCDNCMPVVLGNSISWYSKESFRTITGNDAYAVSVREIVPMEMLMGDICVKSNNLAFIERQVNEFMKNNPSLIDNIFKNSKNVRVRYAHL